MIKAMQIVLLSSLVASIAPAALAASNQGSGAQARSTQTAVATAPPTQAQLKAMSTMRLLKLGQKALTVEMDTQDFVTGLDAVKIASARGDREATRLMAKIMARNQIILGTDDRAKLERRFRFEALRGASSSVLAIAGMYDRGDGVVADPKKAAEWYLWAARVGHERAMAHAAYAYGTGRGLERNEGTALKWLDGVNEGRQRSTLLEIGWALVLGTEGSKDMPAALRFFERAAQIKPGVVYDVALDLERGTRGVQDREAAAHLIRVAAERGDSGAATHLANALASSSDVEDQRRAVQWYGLAAEDKANTAAGQSLSRLLALRPPGGIVSDIVAALEKAKAAGNTEALVGLAHAYSEGIGVDASPEKAAALLQEASDAGHPEAKYKLGLMYKSGLGVMADLNKAVELMTSARDSGYPLAAVTLNSMMEPITTNSVGQPAQASEASVQ
ncbi:tetratricopeptide repeat protein [Microvirga terrestris]|uniref:Sel1 repeat family protein n=1 Tax=Microvirga terrestris TaxID=2791024 RepID=A0ABS0HVI3_9HYPH|nr:tetratricopeptide repeat protein [Microvirga terrestris]MBF9197177.1 sel1 repeat family protein [Microvirga terrestris]